MFRDLPRYDQYQEASGWVQTVPSHWGWEPARTLFSERRVSGHIGEELLSVTIGRGVIKQADLLSATSKKDSSNLDKSKYKYVEPGDLVYNKMRAWQGAAGGSQYRGIVSPAYIVIRPRSGLMDYFHHLLRTPAFATEAERWSYGITSDQWSLRPEHFKVIRFPVPPVEEQAAIVKYLAHANARIDNAIAAKRRLISLLEEQMRVETSAVMSQAVSDGSKTLPLKRVIDLRGGMTPSKENLSYWGGDVPWISPKDVKSATLLGSIDRITEAALEQTSISMVSAGSVVIVVRGMILARTVPVAVLGVDATLNQDMKALVPKAGVLEPRYLRDWLKSNEDMLVQLVETAGHGTKKLDTDSLMNVKVAVPSVEVQREVCARVDQANQATRRTIERIEQEIVLLQEFRIRLVSDAALGQVDVRAISASLLDAPSGVAMQDIHAAVTNDDFGTDDAGELE